MNLTKFEHFFNFCEIIFHLAITLDAENPARDFHPLLQLYGVFLLNIYHIALKIPN